MNEFDDFQWIRDIKPVIPVTELGPNDKFKIVEISDQALKDYNGWRVGQKYDPYKEIFIMDEGGCFTNIEDREPATDYVVENTTDVWLLFYNKSYNGMWVSVDTIMVHRVD